MTKHTMVTLRLHRSAVILIIVFALIFAILIFVAGYLSGGKRVAKPAAATAAAPQKHVALEARAVPAAQPTVTIRVGMFTTEAEAKALVQRLAAEKIAASIRPLPMDNGATLYLVMTGRYATREEAASAASKLAEELGVETAVMPIE